MPLKIENLSRQFSYNGTVLADPDPRLSVAEVQAFHSTQYPELATAKPVIETKTRGDAQTQTVLFTVAAGTKG